MGIDEKPFINDANRIVPIGVRRARHVDGFLMDVDQP